MTVRLDDPDHPVSTALGGRPLVIADEIAQFGEPYSRQKVHVLLSLDTARSPKAGTRKDNDYPVSWVKSFGYPMFGAEGVGGGAGYANFPGNPGVRRADGRKA